MQIRLVGLRETGIETISNTFLYLTHKLKMLIDFKLPYKCNYDFALSIITNIGIICITLCLISNVTRVLYYNLLYF